MDLNFFPWNRKDVTAYWINPENGIEWWIEPALLKYADEKNIIATPFLLCTKDKEPLERVLVSNKTNDVIHICNSYEEMATHIDILFTKKEFENN